MPCAAMTALVAVLAALTPDARAQPPARPYLHPSWRSTSERPVRPSAGRAATFTTIGVQTSLAVPDGGTATLGGYSSLSEGRTERGVPLLGKLPYTSRGFRNIGYGRSAASTRISVRVRIISLREEEYRQTGFRSR
jgi:type II secretory pathway component GspD/PulD (secretin)